MDSGLGKALSKYPRKVLTPADGLIGLKWTAPDSRFQARLNYGYVWSVKMSVIA